jgi:phage shock protein PspC (stress-responsive transcriptional regulator)
MRSLMGQLWDCDFPMIRLILVLLAVAIFCYTMAILTAIVGPIG